ncbi:MAG: hypothetical protein BWY25_03190 [Chloroflexi bacterium ADurb.Bin222]|nr:MAG: hypothetical protein BWY25_03190 [Chloroflexi bacterium ADurb.Bin222]
MLDLQLIPTLPTLKDLLGPDWETRAAEEAHRTLAEVAVACAWPRELRRQVDESLDAFSWRSPRKYHAVNETLGELGQWREVLASGVQIWKIGPARRRILNRLFEVADTDLCLTQAEALQNLGAALPTVLPTLGELLGPGWAACTWNDAMDVLRTWFNVNPSPHKPLVIRALMAARYGLAARYAHFSIRDATLGDFRDSVPRLLLGPKTLTYLTYLFEISSASALSASLVRQLTQLHERLPAAHRNAWISLGHRMLSRAEAAPTDWADIQSQLSPDQIILWLNLGEQMLRRVSSGEEAH